LCSVSDLDASGNDITEPSATNRGETGGIPSGFCMGKGQELITIQGGSELAREYGQAVTHDV